MTKTIDDSNTMDVINVKVELWKQIQQMIVDVEQRNFGEFLIGSLISLIIALLTEYKERLEFGIVFVPAIMLFALFVVTFNNKTSALLRGYLSGIEDEINMNIGEELFLWNKKYHHIRNNRYFMTNTLSFAQYAVFSILIFVYSFWKMSVLIEDCCDEYKSLLTALFVLYIVFTVFFAFVYAKEQLNNGDSKIFARIYYHIHNKAGLTVDQLKADSPDDISDDKYNKIKELCYKYHNSKKIFSEENKELFFRKKNK